MNSTTVGAVINLVTALIPTITQASSTLFTDAKNLIAAAQQSSDVTAEQLQLLDVQAKACDAAQDAAYAAYKAQTSGAA